MTSNSRVKATPLSPVVWKQVETILARASRDEPADAVLRSHLKENRLTPENARDVSKCVFCYFRWFGWLDKKRPLSAQIRRALDINESFRSEPDSFTDPSLNERAVPDWVWPHLVPGLEIGWARALQHEPRLWLRTKPGAIQGVAHELSDCKTANEILGYDRLPDGLMYHGRADLFRTQLFHEGMFELQDLASQAVGAICATQPSETWWDACAGEGGKTLHLAMSMGTKGLVWASDRAAWRLALLKRRTARAKVFNYRAAQWDGGPRLPVPPSCHGVLVDAPCSGLGTWQRNPHARWTLSLEDIQELAQVQQQLLQHASKALKVGGRLVYSVCTLTQLETIGVCEVFSREHSNFESLPFVWYPGDSPQPTLTLVPSRFPANGMFIAQWRRVR